MRHAVFVRRPKKGLGSPEAYAIIRKAVNITLIAEAVPSRCEVNILLTDDDDIHRYNLEFRSVDAPTDVLSFPQFELSPGSFEAALTGGVPEEEAILLGDVVLSLERARRQASEYGHSERREIAYLTVHGVLHLLGYDHVDEGPDKRIMRAREKEIMGIFEGTAR